MPIYMDRHDLPGVTAKDVAAAHQKDLNIQEQFGCRALTYWFDEKRITAFCLVEAPDAAAVQAMHNHAHGLVPHRIIEVDPVLVESFLGRITDPKVAATGTAVQSPTISEPAFRVIMAVAVQEHLSIRACCKEPGAVEKLTELKNYINKTVCRFNGNEAANRQPQFLFSFLSAANAMDCAVELQQSIAAQKKSTGLIAMKIGLSAGVPVTGNKAFFGEAVQLAKRLTAITKGHPVVVAAAVDTCYREEQSHPINTMPAVKILSTAEEVFLHRLFSILEEKFNDPAFTILHLAKAMYESKSQLYRKMMAVTALAPNSFIKAFRLQQALTLLDRKEHSITEVAYTTGFTSPSYFSKCFHQQFGMSPSRFAATAV